MTLKMINAQYADNPLARIVNSNNPSRSLLTNKKDWRPATRSSLADKRIDPDVHFKAVDKLRSLGYNYEHISDKLGDCTSDINRMYLEFTK